jgi:ubiquinone/menaquinone biosynthesis C-methylase UbiE
MRIEHQIQVCVSLCQSVAKRSFALALLACLSSVAIHGAQEKHPLTGRQIAGVATDAEWLERAERQQEEEPDRALDLIGIDKGLVVADVGAGSGYITTRLARRVGPTGKVYANDLQPAMVARLRERVRREGLQNVEPVQGSEADANLPAAAIDLVIMVDVYHEMHQPQAMLQSLRRALKPGARLVLLEFRKEDPNVPIRLEHKMSVAEARTEITAEGFTFERVIGGLPWQHILVFRKATGE